MSKEIKIKKGLNINLFGEAEKTVFELNSKQYAIKPTDFVGVFPKLLVQEGDVVKAGSPIFYDKYREDIQFTAPVSGKIIEIKRGAKRVLQEIIIEADNGIEYESFGKAKPDDLKKEEIIEKLLKSGIWPFIRQRPYSIIADPKAEPKVIFVSGFDSSPLAPDYDFLVHGKGDEFQTGLDIIAKLTSGKVHLNINTDLPGSRVFTNSKNVQINNFTGPHPSGNVGTQINKLDPINKGDIVWYLRPQEIITIGKLFLEGKYDASRVIALTGSEIKKTSYYKTYIGASIEGMINNNLKQENVRCISGNVLTGTKIEKTGFMSFYDYQLTVIPEGDHHDFMGWMLPGLKKHSFYRTFIAWLTPKKKFKVHTNINGGERAFVMTGQFEKVFPFDIYPMQLIKAIIIEDIDAMENLGIYEVDEEDFALCEYISTSKINIQSIVRNGLDMIRKEMS
ncbi:MAG: Na(+)-translocating NADH-quinone reductase subunit A [Bacteroidales bacterium]|nr:Na(+)-translocating NADH-quinone reductase subunit A [Bacteroidales bacterium]